MESSKITQKLLVKATTGWLQEHHKEPGNSIPEWLTLRSNKMPQDSRMEEKTPSFYEVWNHKHTVISNASFDQKTVCLDLQLKLLTLATLESMLTGRCIIDNGFSQLSRGINICWRRMNKRLDRCTNIMKSGCSKFIRKNWWVSTITPCLCLLPVIHSLRVHTTV